nr:beta-ketoacyl-ACP synthase II [uncultured Rhodopila sp.]
MRRVVVTGMGIVCPLGSGVENVWGSLIAGQSGIGAIHGFNSTDLPSRVAGQVPYGVLQGQEARTWRVSALALLAAREAIAESGWTASNAEVGDRSGVSIGSGCGGLNQLYESAAGLHAGTGALPAALMHTITTELAAEFHLGGPRRAVSTACASGTHAIGDAARIIMAGDADLMLAGGTEAAICEIGMAGFAAARALSTRYNDSPSRASRPWDRDRDGFVMGEGAGMMVLEDMDQAKRRGASILAEIVGYGMSGDAYHIAMPAEGHDGAFRAMRNALRSARVRLDQVQYVNAHGTSTPAGDDLELEAVERLFGDAARHLMMSSTKSATGHLLGASGAVEAIFSVLAIRDGVAPPTLNLDNASRTSVIDRVALTARQSPINAALSNSFGFGGTNASILFRAA